MNSRLIALSVALGMLSACGSSSSAPSGGDVGAALRSDAVTTVPDDSGPEGTVPAQGRTVPAGDERAEPGRAGREGSAPADEVPPPWLSPLGGPGTFAPAYLRPDMTASIVVEIHTQAGASISQANIDHAMGELRTATGKNVEVVGPLPLETERRNWSADDIRSAADSASRFDQTRDHAVMRILVLRGQLSSNDQALGVAVRGDVLAIFSEKVSEGGGVLSPRSRVEQAVVLHEVGHLLGLVDLYLKTGRQDPEHPGHSTNPGSVMYWAVETTLVGQVLNGPPPVTFDDQDRADLAAIRGGAMP